MKKLVFLIIIAMTMVSCEQDQKSSTKEEDQNNNNDDDFSSNKNENLEAPNEENNLLKTPCYIVSVSAYIEKTQEIRNKGYNAGYLYLPDYASLSKKLYFSAYVGPVYSESECQRLVRQVRRDYKDAYGILVSDDPEWRVTIRPEGIKRRRN